MGASGNPAIYFYDRIILISTLACHIKDAIPPSQRRILEISHTASHPRYYLSTRIHSKPVLDIQNKGHD